MTIYLEADMDDAYRLIKELVITATIVIGVLWLLAICFWMYPSMVEVRKMDCAMAEFSPDMSLEVKQACREARSKK
jgi:hypothetical protein